MKIAHLVCTFPPYTGGMGNVAFEQVKRLSKNHQVTVFALEPKEGPKEEPGSQVLPEPGSSFGPSFQVAWLKPWFSLGNGGFCPQIIGQLKKFDIIQLHYPFFGVQEVLWLARALSWVLKPSLTSKKQKLIIFYHMDVKLESGLQKFLSLPSRLIWKNLFRQADQICCASIDYVKHSHINDIYFKYHQKFVEMPFGSRFCESQKHTRLPDGQENTKTQKHNSVGAPLVGAQAGEEDSKQLKSKLGIQEYNKIILFVGGLDSAHYFKGVDVLIKAFNKLTKETQNLNYKLVIVGDGNLRPQYEQQAKKLNLHKQVIFTGSPTDQELPAYYQMCDIFVLPSLNQAEAFGLVLIEAKTFGKAVIGSDLPGVRDVVGDQTSGFVVKPGDVDDLYSKLRILLEDDDLRQKFGQAGQKQVEEKYNWDRHVDKLEQVCLRA